MMNKFIDFNIVCFQKNIFVFCVLKVFSDIFLNFQDAAVSLFRLCKSFLPLG